MTRDGHRAALAARHTVAIGRACDGACIFCAQDGLERDAVGQAGVQAALERARAAGAEAVTLVGGEPGIAEGLEAHVERARALGFRRIGVQTNGFGLARDGRIEALVRAGLTDVHLSVHGAEARVHDWHAGRAGAFDAAMRTMAAARAAGLAVVVVTVLTRSSFRVLAPLPRLLASRGAGAWCLQVPRWRGRAAARADSVVPRLSLALPFALHALDAAARLGLPAFVRGAPACLLGPFAARAIDGAADGERAFGAPCAACPSRASCAGVDAEYLARFGDKELSPCAPVARAAGRDELRAMFVGVGETAPPVDVTSVAPPPERARVALPVLGRPTPAVREVPASAPKQSGEALRAILPGLFEGASEKPKGPGQPGD
jgi:hypothetical protein